METEKITITLPTSLYYSLRNQAKKQNLSLPEFIEKRIKLQPSNPSLSTLPLNQLLKTTAPKRKNPLDFYE